MNRKTLLALALTGVYAFSTAAVYAEDEKKETEKPQLVAEDEKKDAEKPQLVAEDEKKDAEKPQLAA
ncbi:MAG: hypothetical protein AABZ67_00290 [Pseudomonadota bacterium]